MQNSHNNQIRQRELETHQRNLADELLRAAQYGGEVFAPVEVRNAIYEARRNIARIEESQLQNQNELIKKIVSRLRYDYLNSYEKSLLGQEIRLSFVYKPYAVLSRRSETFGETDQSLYSIPVEMNVYDIYNEAGSLLILGEPGSGKTTALIGLARELTRKVLSEGGRIPLFLTLSSWAVERKQIDEWIIDELLYNYKIGQNYSKEWFKDGLFVLLLDGLDELKLQIRVQCIESINAFYAKYSLTNIVVCSRIEDYMSLYGVRLNLLNAVEIQPLELDMLNAYFRAADLNITALEAELIQNIAFQKFVSTPLILSTIIKTYKNTSIDAINSLLNSKPEERRNLLFANYVNRVFEHEKFRSKTAGSFFTVEQTRRWLSKIASHLYLQGSTVFYPEYIETSWLKTSKQRWFYSLFSRPLLLVFFFFATNLASAVVTFIAIFFPYLQSFFQEGFFTFVIALIFSALFLFLLFIIAMFFAAFIGLVLGVLFGFPIGLVHGERNDRLNSRIAQIVRLLPKGDFYKILTLNVILGMPLWLFFQGLSDILNVQRRQSFLFDFLTTMVFLSWLGIDILVSSPKLLG